MGVLTAVPRAEQYDGRLRRAIATVRNSVLLSMAAFGVVLILLGYVIHTGPWAAILATWGGGLVIVGLLGYAYVRWKRN